MSRRDKPPRWRWRFRLSTMLWATAVVAMTLGWWLDHRHLSNALRTLRDNETTWAELELYRKRVLILQRAIRELSRGGEHPGRMNAEISQLKSDFEVTIANNGPSDGLRPLGERRSSPSRRATE